MSQQLPTNHFAELLHSHQLRATHQRLDLLHILGAQPQPVTADDLLDLLSAAGCSVHRATVYRDLEKMAEHGLLQRLVFHTSMSHYYELSTDSHHHHFLCESCHRITDVSSEEVETALANVGQQLAKSGISVTSHTLKLYGRCGSCSERAR